VAIIGGGITGALVGYFLSLAGVGVVRSDRGEVGAGSTSASTGLLQYEIDTPLVELVDRVGETHAVAAYRRGKRAIDELEGLVAELPGTCGFARRPTLCLASSQADARDLQREHECRRHFGFDVRLVEPRELKEVWGLGAPGALHSLNDAEVDPYSLTQLTLKAAQANGLRAFGSTPLSDIRETASGVELRCGDVGMTANSAVFCTGYFNQPWFPRGSTRLHTTYAACSHPMASIEHWSDRCLIWETARPYFYARQTPDGRIIIGGEDTPHSDDHESDKLLEAKSALLKDRFERLLSARFVAEFQWAGTFAETEDGLPFIGPVPGQQRIFSALGYGGNGITFSMIAARLITDLILKRQNEDAAIFRFGR